MFTWLLSFTGRFLPIAVLEKFYVDAGKMFGCAVSYSFLGKCEGFDRMLNSWERWEKTYAAKGFRTISLDKFINAGGYGHPLIGLREKRNAGEEPVFHAVIYRKKYLENIQPIIDLTKNEVQMGTWETPSTEIPKDKKDE